MNWYAYLPPAISIYLILISGVISGYLKYLVRSISTTNPAIEQSKPVIKDVALDWAARLGFINSMLVAFVSCFSIYTGTQSYGWAVGTFVVLLLLFIPLLYWIISQGAGQLVTTKRYFNMLNSTVCNIALLIVYIVLIAAIAISQNLAPHTTTLK